MNNLRDKILDTHCPVILYELLPPTSNDSSNVEAYVECAIDLLTSASIKIDAVNIPEIHDENHKENKEPQVCLPKLDSREFAQILENASYNQIKVILNRATVYETMEEQLQWIQEATQLHKTNTIILVGGSSNTIEYPGPSVLKLSNFIKNNYQQDELFCGGITIQSRRYPEQEKDEPNRLIAKALNGIEFFTSQIIYDSVCIKLLLRDYAQACQKQNILPKRIFLSFAPIANKKDLDFLRWLGASIPRRIENELFKADIGIGWRSAKVAVTILEDILSFMQHENIQVPLGLNIEHITRHNFEISLRFIERLGKLYQNYMLANGSILLPVNH
jgi:5,10-methylenetetrahydrofolate reductase